MPGQSAILKNQLSLRDLRRMAVPDLGFGVLESCSRGNDIYHAWVSRWFSRQIAVGRGMPRKWLSSDNNGFGGFGPYLRENGTDNTGVNRWFLYKSAVSDKSCMFSCVFTRHCGNISALSRFQVSVRSAVELDLGWQKRRTLLWKLLFYYWLEITVLLFGIICFLI